MLLVTAFQPFDGTGLNSAQEALHTALPQLGPQVVTAEPPVVWGRDVRTVWPLVEQHRPAAILLLGQGGGARVRVETIARNLRWVRSRPAELRPILRHAPATLLTTAPAEALVATIESAGVDARLSDDAGTYLCNHLYFQALYRLNRYGWRLPTVFVHLPLLPSQVAGQDPPEPSLAVERAAAAVVAVAQCLLAASGRQAG